jgi:excisionase family DNA binding protein
VSTDTTPREQATPAPGAIREPPNRAARRRRRPPVQAVQPQPGRMALTVPEAAWELNCHPNTVWNLIRDGQLESFTLGRKRLVARSAVEGFIKAGGGDAA